MQKIPLIALRAIAKKTARWDERVEENARKRNGRGAKERQVRSKGVQ